jgi:hypothetical protein
VNGDALGMPTVTFVKNRQTIRELDRLPGS